MTVTLKNIFASANRQRVQALLKSPKSFPRPKLKRTAAPRASAVLVPMCNILGKPGILFTKRSASLTHHRGEVSFPGGNQDKTDKDLQETAIREYREELGLPTSEIDVWGTMAPLTNWKQSHVITPVVAYCGDVDLRAVNTSESEVDFVFFRSFEFLCGHENHGRTFFRSHEGIKGKPYALPVFHGAEPRIWGITAIFTDALLTTLCPNLYLSSIR